MSIFSTYVQNKFLHPGDFCVTGLVDQLCDWEIKEKSLGLLDVGLRIKFLLNELCPTKKLLNVCRFHIFLHKKSRNRY